MILHSLIWFLFSVFLFAINMPTSKCCYLKMRKEILTREENMFTGKKIVLNVKEKEANAILLRLKHSELQQGYDDSSKFLPSQSFLDVRNLIEESKVFKVIKQLPKGFSLHTHMLASVSVDYIIKNYTHKENLYGSFVNDVFKLKFFEKCPDNTWKSLQEYRKADNNFDSWLKNRISITQTYQNVEPIWTHFKHIFSTVYDMLAYKPVFEDYIYQMLKELYQDKVYYAEIRGTMMPLYDFGDKNDTAKDFFETLINTVEKFKKEHPKFLGVKYIHSIYRGVDREVLKEGLKELLEYRRIFPDFIVGFDFVGFEEDGHMLVDYLEELLEVKDELKFFFHAGETPWFGHTDLNLADAVMLNSTRIGHGFALTEHPILLDLARSKNIPIELCPISNQVLGLNQDPRNHPAVNLLATSYPVVICNDDPSLWGASGLSHDFYVVFMAMTARHSGIEVLKKFAIDSIEYSMIEDKGRALEMWKEDWDIFLDDILKVESDSA